MLQIERKILDISDMMQMRLATQLAEDFGVNLKRLDISAIEIDQESEDYQEFVHVTKEQQKIIAEQVGRRAAIETDIYEQQRHLATESQYIQAHAINQQTEVLKAAANNLGEMGQMNLDGGVGGMNPAGMMMGMAMGGAMGGQMANMMTGVGQMQQQAMQAQQPTPPPMPPMMQYYVNVNGQNIGPCNMQQLQQMVQSGQLTLQTYVWKQGMATWDFARNIQELSMLFGAVPPPMPPTPPVPPKNN